MDSNAASAPNLISSLEAMIQASIAAVLDRRLGPADDTLDVKIDNAVAAALNKRLGPAVGSLGNRMTSLIDQRLGNAVGTLNYRVNTSVTTAMERRLGPAGSALTAQITFGANPFSLSPSLPATKTKAQMSDELNGTKENSRTCCPEKELAIDQKIGFDGSLENKQATETQDEIESTDTKMAAPDFSDEASVPTVTSEKGNEPISKGTDTADSAAQKNAVYPLFADSVSKRKPGTCSALTAKPTAITEKPSGSAEETRAKRKANQREDANKAGDTDESDSSSSEEEKSKKKPKRKRAKIKLDPPGYKVGPGIKFRRVSPKLTACTKSRGYPRVIDLRSFTEASNKQNFTMADVVATLLFNYDPLSLFAFMDMDDFPTYRFTRNESNRKARNFVIERHRESYGGVVVKVSDIRLIAGRIELMQRGSAGITFLRSTVPKLAPILTAYGRPDTNILSSLSADGYQKIICRILSYRTAQREP